MRAHVAVFGVVYGEYAAAVDDQVEHAVVSGDGLAEFGVVEYGDGDTGKSAAVAGEHFPPQKRRPVTFDCPGGDPGLDRIAAGVEEGGAGGDGCGNGTVDPGSDGCRVGRDDRIGGAGGNDDGDGGSRTHQRVGGGVLADHPSFGDGGTVGSGYGSQIKTRRCK